MTTSAQLPSSAARGVGINSSGQGGAVSGGPAGHGIQFAQNAVAMDETDSDERKEMGITERKEVDTEVTVAREEKDGSGEWQLPQRGRRPNRKRRVDRVSPASVQRAGSEVVQQVAGGAPSSLPVSGAIAAVGAAQDFPSPPTSLPTIAPGGSGIVA